MARIEASVVINRPVEEVFGFVTNPRNDVLWQSGVLESEQTSEGPMGVGTTFRTVGLMMGRQMEMTAEVAEYEPNRKIKYKGTSGPMSTESSFTLEPVEGGTRVSFVGEAETGGVFKRLFGIADAIMVRMGQRSWETDLANLKDILEAEA